MLELEEALAGILGTISTPLTERISSHDALGRFLAETVCSPIDIPPFDNSAMDGYAVRAAEVASATTDAPVHLRVLGKAPAGDAFSKEISPGYCVRLFTGSLLPNGADSVVMQEDTRINPYDPDEVLILDGVQRGENVRSRGEDIRRGAVLVEAGERLTSSKISLLTAGGVPEILVGSQPCVGLLATGSELREPGEALGPGQIYESNRIAL